MTNEIAELLRDAATKLDYEALDACSDNYTTYICARLDKYQSTTARSAKALLCSLGMGRGMDEFTDVDEGTPRYTCTEAKQNARVLWLLFVADGLDDKSQPLAFALEGVAP